MAPTFEDLVKFEIKQVHTAICLDHGGIGFSRQLISHHL
jgi:hypothetical protein